MLQEIFEKPVDHSVASQPEMAVPFNLIGTPEEQAAMADLVNRVAESPFGKEILQDASALGYSLRMDDLGQATKGVCRSTKQEIVLSNRVSLDTLVVTLAHEGRHAGQIGRGAIAGYIPACSLSSLVPHKRLMEADAVTASIVVAHELLQVGDYMPLSMARRDYENMAQTYESSLENGQSQAQAMTQCALGWYDQTARKMAYEEDHIMTPLKEGFYALNTAGGYSDLDQAAGMQAICTYKDGTYFSEPPEVLETPERAGMSSYTAQWVEAHVEQCKKAFNTDVSDVVRGMPVYDAGAYMVSAKEAKYGQRPETLSAKGAERIQTAVQKGILKQLPIAAVILKQQQAGR